MNNAFKKAAQDANDTLNELTEANAMEVFKSIMGIQPEPPRVYLVQRVGDNQGSVERMANVTGVDFGEEDVLVKIMCEDSRNLAIGQLGFLVHKMSLDSVSFLFEITEFEIILFSFCILQCFARPLQENGKRIGSRHK